MSKKRTCILMIGVAAFFCAGPALAGPGIAPIGSKITTVKTYADLGAEWFQWAVQAPATDNPVDDKTGAKCRVSGGTRLVPRRHARVRRDDRAAMRGSG